MLYKGKDPIKKGNDPIKKGNDVPVIFSRFNSTREDERIF